MRPKNTTPIKELKAERKRLEKVIETFLLESKLYGKPLTKQDWCLKAKLDKCYISVVLTDKTFQRRIGEKAATKLCKAVGRRSIKINKSDLRPDLFGGKHD